MIMLHESEQMIPNHSVEFTLFRVVHHSNEIITVPFHRFYPMASFSCLHDLSRFELHYKFILSSIIHRNHRKITPDNKAIWQNCNKWQDLLFVLIYLIHVKSFMSFISQNKIQCTLFCKLYLTNSLYLANHLPNTRPQNTSF